MTQHYLIVFLMLAASSVMEISCRPSNEPTTSVGISTEKVPPVKERALVYDEINTENVEVAKKILEKIKAINDGLQKPNRRQQSKWNLQPQTGGGYVIDKETLEKLQQVIASGKLQSNSNTFKKQEIDNDNEDLNDFRNSRQLSHFPSNQLINVMPMPYMMSLPVLIIPSPNMHSVYPNLNMGYEKYQSKAGPTLPFDIPWPLASVFPILIRDPLLNILNGGGWNNLIEYGQEADVCKHTIKSNQVNEEHVMQDKNEVEKIRNFIIYPNDILSRKKRAIKKKTVANKNQPQKIVDPKKVQKFFSSKPTTTPKPTPATKDKYDFEGDFRLPFGDFGWFGHKNAVLPSPGFIINRLKVRKGGVAIAGPGGVATAGNGGTAIVGPGGLAYTQPGGVAIAGPAARVVALTPNSDLTAIVTRLQQQSAIDGSVSQLIQAIPEGKIVATGPIIYEHPKE